jgi:hypothetical protein
MMTETLSWHWAFPGGLAGLLVTFAAAATLIWFAYRRTLRQLSPGWRWTLTGLRCLMLLLLLGCLATPQMVASRSFHRDLHKPLAVLVDASGSMVRPDARGQTRLGLARAAVGRIWDNSGPLRLFTFAGKLQPASTPAALDSISDPERETHLLASLAEALDTAPPGGWGGVIVFTDGDDTTAADPEETGRLFRSHQTPLVVAATQTDLPQPEIMRLAGVTLQPSNTVQTEYPLEVLIGSTLTAPRQVTVRVLQNNQPVKESTLTLSPGSHTQKASFTFIGPAPGRQDYEIQLLEEGKNDPLDRFFASTQVVERPVVHALYYSGSLSIEYRYLRAALAQNPAIELESSVHIDASALRHQILFGNQSRTSADASSFPNTVDELRPYDVIILADLLPSQLSAPQTAALLDYVKNGGGLIFVVSNSAVASDFSGSQLEQLLPVVFEPNPEAASAGDDDSGHGSAASRLLAKLNELGPVGGGNSAVGQLVPMEFTADGRSMLGTLGDQPEDNAPLFREYAAVQRAKPGAIVAAQHPNDSDTWGKRPLLAMERFGQGRSAVLATDSIWRWQLSLPSTSRAYGKLWQQILLWVAQRKGTAPEIQVAGQAVSPNENVPVVVKLPEQAPSMTAAQVVLTAHAPDGTSQPVPLAPGTAAGTFTGSFAPAAGPWVRLEAAAPNLNLGLAMVNVRAGGSSVEDQHLALDLPALQRLAAAAGGQVLDAASLRELPPLAVSAEEAVVDKKVRDLWNNGAVLAAVLGLFCVELLLRRALKLL